MAKRQTRGLLPQDAQSQSNLLQSIASEAVTPVSPGNQGGFDRVGEATKAVSSLASSLVDYKQTKRKIKADKDNDVLSRLEQEWLDEQEKWKAAREKDADRMQDEILSLGLEDIDQRDIGSFVQLAIQH